MSSHAHNDSDLQRLTQFLLASLLLLIFFFPPFLPGKYSNCEGIYLDTGGGKSSASDPVAVHGEFIGRRETDNMCDLTQSAREGSFLMSDVTSLWGVFVFVFASGQFSCTRVCKFTCTHCIRARIGCVPMQFYAFMSVRAFMRSSGHLPLRSVMSYCVCLGCTYAASCAHCVCLCTVKQVP